MHTRKILLAFAALAAISPSLSNASGQKNALNACVHAFASSIAAPGSAAPTFKLNYQGDQEEGPLASYYGRQFTFYLHARNAKTGLPIANATCSATTRGSIVALTSAPLDNEAPALAARL